MKAEILIHHVIFSFSSQTHVSSVHSKNKRIGLYVPVLPEETVMCGNIHYNNAEAHCSGFLALTRPLQFKKAC